MDSEKSFEDLKLKISILESKISENDNFLKILFNIIPNPLFYKNINGVYEHCNEAFSKTILGLSKEEIVGKTLYDFPDIIPKEFADIYSKKDNELIKNGGEQNYVAKVKCSDGQIRYFNFYKSTFEIDGKVEGLVGIMLDITEYKKALIELNEKNEILNNLSITDFLTSLNNRRYFQEVFEKKLSLLDRHNHKFSFAIIDIDFFKDYNDSYGHQLGDEVLIKIANIIKNTFNRPNDYAFRLGGEEFGLLFNVEKDKDAYKLVENLRKNVESARIEASNYSVSEYVTVSIGLGNINKLKKDELDVDFIYDEVDKLLYLSKRKGRNQISSKNFE